MVGGIYSQVLQFVVLVGVATGRTRKGTWFCGLRFDAGSAS